MSYENYLQKKDFAMAFLVESVDAEIRPDVIDRSSPMDAWRFLTKQYGDENSVPSDYEQWTSLSQKDCISLSHYLRKVQKFCMNLNDDDIPTTADECKRKMISGLKHEYVTQLFQTPLSMQTLTEMDVPKFVEVLLGMEEYIEG